MDQAQANSAVSSAGPSQSKRPSRARRPALWRAVAGMAAALALASAIVAIEMSSELVSRITHYRSRIATLNKRVDKLKRETALDQARLARSREQLASKDRLKMILLAPDLKTIRLAAAKEGDVADGTVSISEARAGAVLTVLGMPSLPDGHAYDAWWMLKNGSAAKAAEFGTAIEGTANIYLDPPPSGAGAIACEITAEPSKGSLAPSGPVKLKGRITEERSGGGKKR